MVQECLNCLELRKRITELEDKIFSLHGWKGKDNISISKVDDEWIILEHRKDKGSGEVLETKHIISHSDVLFLKNVLDKFYVKGVRVLYAKKDLWNAIISIKRLPVELEAFNGGRNRNLFYFRYYYYPVKILEHLGWIEYSGHGKITLINNYFGVN